jgi:hypothetical protein
MKRFSSALDVAYVLRPFLIMINEDFPDVLASPVWNKLIVQSYLGTMVAQEATHNQIRRDLEVS